MGFEIGGMGEAAVRPTTQIIVHCIDSDRDVDINEVRRWHMEERHFRDVGYHAFVRRDGTIELGREIDVVGAHCEGQNEDSIGIAISAKDLATDDCLKSLKKLILIYMDKYKIPIENVHGHRDYTDQKTCPNFPTILLRAFIENPKY